MSMNDLKPFEHGQEGTHYACDVALKEGNGCCGCSRHDCSEEGAQGYMKVAPSSPKNPPEPSSSEGSWEDKLAIIYCENCGKLPNENMCQIYNEALEKARQSLLKELLEEGPKYKQRYDFPIEELKAEGKFIWIKVKPNGKTDKLTIIDGDNDENSLNQSWRTLLEGKKLKG